MAQSQFIVPKNRRDKVFFLLMAILIPLTIVWEFGVIVPNYHRDVSSTVLFHIVACSYIVMNIFGNILLIMRTDASGRLSFLPSIQTKDWKFCYACQLNSPPRSYHCQICKECVLKRDHHCAFTGCCIGYHNHRYYVVAITYILLGTLYAVIYQWEYCFTQMGGFGLSSVLSLMAPHFALLLGYLSVYGCFVSTVQVVGLIIIFMTSYLVVTQLSAILKGQTQYERKHSITTYNLGWKSNVVDVFGTRWCLVWMFPTISSPLLGDGLKFNRIHEYEDVKNM